jgi:tetratricopeptide (TPR) repeat protein
MRSHPRIVSIQSWFSVVLLLSLARGIALGQAASEYQQQAAELARSYRFPEAIELIQTGLRQHLGNVELTVQLGMLLVQTGNTSQGEQFLRDALARQPHRLELLDALATAELRQGRARSAVSLLEDILWHRPDDAQAQHRLARALFLGGEFHRALEPARRSVDLNPLDSVLRRFYSLLLDIQGNKEESYRQLKAACQLDPQNASLWFHLSEKECQAGKLEDALKLLRKASQLDPENPLYHSALSQLYHQLGQKGLSIEEASKGRELTEAFEGYTRTLALATKGERRAAVELLQPFVQSHPEFITGALFLAGLYSMMGHEQAALDLYLDIVSRYPNQAVARHEAAWILAQKGDYERALEMLGILPVHDPGRTLVEAYSREQVTDYAGALEALRRVQSQNPLNPDVLLWIAHCLRARGQNQEALEVLGRAEKLRPGNAAIQKQVEQTRVEQQRAKASELFQARQWKEALHEFAVLAATAGEGAADSATLFQTAYCHQQLGNLKEALQMYRAGLKADPQASWARQNLAGILYQLGRYQEAASQWEQVPRELRAPEIWQQLGFCYAHLGRYEAAESSLQLALNFGLTTPPLLYHLGLTRLRRMPSEEAWYLIRRSAAANYPPAKDLLKQARLSP